MGDVFECVLAGSLALFEFVDQLWIRCGSDVDRSGVWTSGVTLLCGMCLLRTSTRGGIGRHTCVSYTLHTNRPQPRGRFVEPPDPDDDFHGCSWATDQVPTRCLAYGYSNSQKIPGALAVVV